MSDTPQDPVPKDWWARQSPVRQWLIVGAMGLVVLVVTVWSRSTSTSAPLSPEAAVDEAVSKKMGRSNRDIGDRVEVSFDPATSTYTIKFAINDNLTDGIRKDGMRLDVVDGLKGFRGSVSTPYELVVFEGTFAYSDAYGGTREMSVVRSTYSSATVDRLDFETISFKRILDVPPADGAAVHRDWRY